VVAVSRQGVAGEEIDVAAEPAGIGTQRPLVRHTAEGRLGEEAGRDAAEHGHDRCGDSEDANGAAEDASGARALRHGPPYTADERQPSGSCLALAFAHGLRTLSRLSRTSLSLPCPGFLSGQHLDE